MKNILVIRAEFDHFCDSLYVYSPLAPVYLEMCPNIHYVLRTRWPANIQHRRNWEMLFYCFVVWFLLSGVVAAFCIFNLYLFPGGSLRTMVSVSGTHWSHSHLEAAVQPQSGLLASEQLGAVRVNALLKGTSEVVMRAVFHSPIPDVSCWSGDVNMVHQ